MSITSMARSRIFMSILAFFMSYFILNFDPSLSQSSICLPEKHTPLFIFGDSLFDAGNNDYINATTFLQANFPPYGETFFKYPPGRFSDGRVIPDFIAEYGELPIIPPYLHPGYNIDEYIYGVNFASAGAGALPETNPGLVIDLKTQINYYREVGKQVRQKLGDVEAKKLLSRAVYIFSIGGNDYGTPLLANTTSVVLPYPQQEFVDLVVGNITAAIREIYKEGGRKFGFVNVGPLNCFPLLRRVVNGTTISACLEQEASALARLHNNALPKILQKLQKQLKGFRYSITDFNGALIELMKDPSKYGFEEGNAACCGGGPCRGDYSCRGKRGIQEYELCDNVDKYVFFDSLHPTESAAEHFAKLMWSGNKAFIESYNLKQLFDYV